MNWTERIKLAWEIFKREALPLYAWTLIYGAVSVVLIIALAIGAAAQLRWALPQSYGGYFSPGMPVPGVPPTSGAPFSDPFGLHRQNPFGAFNGSLGDISGALGNVAGTLILIIVVSWLIGTAYYTGLFNLTAKAYRERVTLKDFRYVGFFRVLGWQGILLLIELLLLFVGLVGALALKNSHGVLIAYLVIYGLFILVAGIFALPWLSTSAIYLLAHRRDSFRKSLGDSWKFFRQHMGILWGYIGTVVLIEIGIQVLHRISSALGGLAVLVVSPFIAVLAIVWVLSLEESEHPENPPLPSFSYTPSANYPYTETTSESISNPSTESTAVSDTNSLASAPSASSADQPISLEKSEPLKETAAERSTLEPSIEPEHPRPEKAPNFCPSCGRANAGTAYCPQCGTKL
ncbi:zinc ribbon domain-containing protein [Desulfosporosinus sp. SB140]|uniref:zinc ribbon domain-containing protein n=1 Tax=Desulfosporosinus paludis TaxID=3115649 RepID=UPI00388F8181